MGDQASEVTEEGSPASHTVSLPPRGHELLQRFPRGEGHDRLGTRVVRATAVADSGGRVTV